MDAQRPTEGHPQWWAVDRFMEDEHWEDNWAAILSIIDKTEAKEVLALLTAGPLEDLIHSAGPHFIDRIEHEARRSSAFRHLLGGVWESSTSEIWAWLERACGESG
ncbi:DUF6869 domain-containing protein [Lysobacter sp. Root916]|uniref:DUF6869 domain-containing protein n=1 Tax=Lysobacter sp. Root916 TaxID=1736606 RepID=UPI000709B0BD